MKEINNNLSWLHSIDSFDKFINIIKLTDLDVKKIGYDEYLIRV